MSNGDQEDMVVKKLSNTINNLKDMGITDEVIHISVLRLIAVEINLNLVPKDVFVLMAELSFNFARQVVDSESFGSDIRKVIALQNGFSSPEEAEEQVRKSFSGGEIAAAVAAAKHHSELN